MFLLPTLDNRRELRLSLPLYLFTSLPLFLYLLGHRMREPRKNIWAFSFYAIWNFNYTETMSMCSIFVVTTLTLNAFLAEKHEPKMLQHFINFQFPEVFRLATTFTKKMYEPRWKTVIKYALALTMYGMLISSPLLWARTFKFCIIRVPEARKMFECSIEL